MPSILNEPVKLPCGLVFPNRLVKAALAELLAGTSNSPTTPDLLSVYSQWAKGNWGAILTGNVQVDINHLGTPFDAALTSPYTDKSHNATLVEIWSQYATTCQTHGTPSIVQLVHPGRQSPRIAGRRGIFAPSVAPSAIPLVVGDGLFERFISWLAFPAPKELSAGEVEEVVRQFVDAARLMADAGFSGVELHGAHGYLIDQFLNPKTNHRTDEYGGTAEKRAKFVVDIMTETRKVVPSTFAIGIKLNSADHSSSNFEDTMTQIGLLTAAGIDFLEVSGGSYEDPQMVGHGKNNQQPQPQSARTAAREAFFLEFATQTRARYPGLTLMLTGGFRTRAGAEDAIRQNACDLVGMGRPAVINPSLPEVLLSEGVSDTDAGLPLKKVSPPWYARLVPMRSIGAGLETAYYSEQLKRVARRLLTYVPG